MTSMHLPDEKLPPELLEAIRRQGGTRRYPAHQVLIQEGETGDSFYVLLSGRVKVYTEAENGREFVLGEFGAGEYLGELSLDGDSRSASVMTLEPTECCVVSGEGLTQFLASQPEFGAHLTLKLIRMVRRLTEQVKGLALRDVYGRIVHMLMEMSDPQGEQRVVRQRLTQQDIADRVGSSREMVHRVMKELTIGGYVATDETSRLLVIRKKLPPAW
jgi:CRP/FNR family transcriptional regulator, cyclic AMP receptor protein